MQSVFVSSVDMFALTGLIINSFGKMTAHFSTLFYATKKGEGEKPSRESSDGAGTEIANADLVKTMEDQGKRLDEVEHFAVEL